MTGGRIDQATLSLTADVLTAGGIEARSVAIEGGLQGGVLNLARLNVLLADLPEEQRRGLRVIDLVFIRPSQDIGRLAADFEVRLPAGHGRKSLRAVEHVVQAASYIGVAAFNTEALDGIVGCRRQVPRRGCRRARG